MNLPILCALFSLAFVDTLPESILGEHEGPAPLSQPFVPPALVEPGSIDAGFSPKGTASLFLATDENGGRLFFPTDAEPIGGADFAEDELDVKVRDLLRREIKAGQLLFNEPRRSELEARGALLIEWLDQGRIPAADQVDQLEARVNQLEKRVTDYLARDFRISVYNAYHTDREEFNHRRARWKLIDERWSKFEQTPERRAHLNQWLAEAIEVSRLGSTTPLPPAPAWYYESVEGLAQQDDSGDVLADTSDPSDPFDVSSPDDFVVSPPPRDPGDVSVPERQIDDFVVEPENTDSFESDDAVPDNATSAADVDVDLTDWFEDNPDDGVTDDSITADRQRETAVVNLDLLTARVAGHNLAVLRLADELGGRNRWTAETLAPHVDRLIDLHERRRDLVAFVELTPPRRRRAIDLIETTQQSVTLLAEKIVGARLRAMGDEFEGNSQQRQAELAALADFSRRLAEIAFDSPNQSDAEIR